MTGRKMAVICPLGYQSPQQYRNTQVTVGFTC